MSDSDWKGIGDIVAIVCITVLIWHIVDQMAYIMVNYLLPHVPKIGMLA